MKHNKAIFSLSHASARRILGICCSLAIIMIVLNSGLMHGSVGIVSFFSAIIEEELGVPSGILKKLSILLVVIGSLMLMVLIITLIRLFFFNQDNMKKRYTECIGLFALFLALPFTLIIPAQIIVPLISWDILFKASLFLITRTLQAKLMTISVIFGLVISILMYRRVMGLGGEIALVGLEDEFPQAAVSGSRQSGTNLRQQGISVTLIRDQDQRRFKADSRGYVVVGRKPQKHALTISDDSALSSNHCQIRLSNSAGYKIRDLGSQNGTKLNGQRIGTKSVPIKSGAKLKLGKYDYTVQF